MAIKKYRSNRAARKNASIVDRSDLYRGRPHKALLVKKTRTSGRGSEGKITTRQKLNKSNLTLIVPPMLP